MPLLLSRCLVRLILALLLLVTLSAPVVPAPAATTGGWQVFTVAHGLVEPPSYRVAPTVAADSGLGTALGGAASIGVAVSPTSSPTVREAPLPRISSPPAQALMP